jgi:ADP-ribosylglycohydrolase
MSIEEKITGCLLGGAVGDALGYPVEFMNWKKIRKIYGSSGITSLESHGSKVEISDDTQMTLFTGEGLLNWLSSESKEDGPEVYLNQAYLDWYATQRQTAGYKPYTQLYGIKELHQLRAPGNACLAALRSQKNGEFGTVEKPVNNSKGCGGIMRAAPAGLIEEKEGWTAASLGAKAAAITHGHPLGYLPAALLAETVHEIVYKDPKKERELTDLLRSALRKVKLQFPQEREMETLEELTEQAIQLARKDEEDHKALRILGEGWTGEETWAVAVFA